MKIIFLLRTWFIIFINFIYIKAYNQKYCTLNSLHAYGVLIMLFCIIYKHKGLIVHIKYGYVKWPSHIQVICTF